MVALLAQLSALPQTSFAQAATGPNGFGPKKQLAVIIFSGLGGAFLGLSTLSFYGRPQDHLQNISTGFAIGIIGGVTYTFYQVTTQPVVRWDRPHIPDRIPMEDSAVLAGSVPLIQYSF